MSGKTPGFCRVVRREIEGTRQRSVPLRQSPELDMSGLSGSFQIETSPEIEFLRLAIRKPGEGDAVLRKVVHSIGLE
jgi:hypothetical protein